MTYIIHVNGSIRYAEIQFINRKQQIQMSQLKVQNHEPSKNIAQHGELRRT